MARPRSPTRADEVLDAALTVFDQVGFDAARVEDIAAAAGVSKGAVYLHFESKVALLEALIARHIEPIAQAAAAMAAAGRADPLAALRAILSTLPERLDAPRIFAVPRLVVASSNRFPAVAERYLHDVLAPVQAALADLVGAAMAQGALRPADVEATARLLMGGVVIEMMRRNVLRDPTAGADAARANVDLLLHLLSPEPAQ